MTVFYTLSESSPGATLDDRDGRRARERRVLSARRVQMRAAGDRLTLSLGAFEPALPRATADAFLDLVDAELPE